MTQLFRNLLIHVQCSQLILQCSHNVHHVFQCLHFLSPISVFALKDGKDL